MEDTSPELSVASKNYGRLYRKPTTDLSKINLDNDTEVKECIIDGTLMPSITNVIAVKNSPFLMTWATKLVAQEAVRIAQTFPHKLTAEPNKAINYLKETANRERDFWGNQGSKIHYAAEQIALGNDIDLSDYTDYEKACVTEWKQWIREYKPKFIGLERTCFGTTPDGLNFAGTSDFIAEIGGKTVIGDYKCVTDDTQIMLESGETVPANMIVVGDRVVAWSEEKSLHVSTVDFVGDNGVKPIVKITTELGQELEVTENHPILVSTANRAKGWVKAEDIQEGSVAFSAIGWSLNPNRTDEAWPLPKGMAPYVYGVLWALYNMRGSLDYDSIIRLPRVTTDGSRFELKDLGFRTNRQGNLIAKHGLDKIARKGDWTPQDVLGTLTVEVPNFVKSATNSVKQAFLAGVTEIFHNHELYPNNYFIVLQNKESLDGIVELYLSLGLVASSGKDPKTGLLYAKLPKWSMDTIYQHGAQPVRIVKVERMQPKHTIAIEVAGAHTHVTNGLITHNTNRSGLHAEIALQLAANAKAQFITMDNIHLTENKPVDMALGVHISPKGVTVKQVDVSDDIYKYFASLRNAWDYAMFEGKLHSPEGVFLRTINSPEEL